MRLNRILNQKDIEDIQHSAFRVLDEVGIRLEHKKTAEMLVGIGRCIYEGGRVYFPVDVMEEFFTENIVNKGPKRERGDFRMGGQWHSWELCDPLTNRPRLATMEEAVNMARLSEALGADTGPIPIAPGDIDPRMNTIVSEMIALIYTRTLGGKLTATDKEEIRILAEMNKAAGRKYVLGLEGLITPLKFNTETLNTYFEWCDDPDVEISIMPNIPMAGATAPLVFPANLALSLAEAMALDFISQVLSDGKLKEFSMRLDPFDFKDGNLVFGTPEWCLLRQAVLELWEGVTGDNVIWGSFRTNGKIVDGQTLMERTASFMWQAALGIRAFGNVGQLCIDEVYSPVQAILDREILKYGRRVFAGIGESCWDRSLDPVQVIREGVRDDGFMMHDTTVEIFRDMYDFGRMTSGCSLGTWKNAGSRPLEQLAWEEAQKVIAGHDFILDDIRRKEVEKLFDRGIRYLYGT